MTTSIRLSSETENRLNVLATETGRSKAYYLRELIEEGIDDLEEHYLTERIMERIRKGEETTHSLDDVEASLGLAD